MTEVLLAIAGFAILILVLVTAHELGHYIVARMANVAVLKFSIGFGRPIWSFTDSRGTEWAIGWLPFGGYVQMVDENDFDVPDTLKPYAFNRKSPWWRIGIAVAGPMANIVLAFVVFCLIYMSGTTVRPAYIGEVFPDSVAAKSGLVAGSTITHINNDEIDDLYDAANELLGYINESTVIQLATDTGTYDLVVTEWVVEDGAPNLFETFGFRFGSPALVRDTKFESPADVAGFLPGDRILAVEGEKVSAYHQVANAIRANPEQPLRVLVSRQDGETAVTLIPERQTSNAGEDYGWAGIEFDSGEEFVRYSPVSVLPKAASETWRYTVQTVDLMGKLVTGSMGTDSLAGPIGIAQIAGQSLAMRWEAFMLVLALISIFLALINLVPLPILDGGHVLYALIEMVIRKPITKKVRIVGNQVSLAMVVALMVFVVYNDLARILAN